MTQTPIIHLQPTDSAILQTLYCCNVFTLIFCSGLQSKYNGQKNILQTVSNMAMVTINHRN